MNVLFVLAAFLVVIWVWIPALPEIVEYGRTGKKRNSADIFLKIAVYEFILFLAWIAVT